MKTENNPLLHGQKADVTAPLNIFPQLAPISLDEYALMHGHRSCVIWLTGLSGAGKSTFALTASRAFHRAGVHCVVIDGDNLRCGLNSDLGFSDHERIESARRTAAVSKMMMEAGIVVITSTISPFKTDRVMARSIIGNENFVEVHVATTLDVCEQRDAKGLYKKARAGNILNFTGISSRYDIPEKPDFRYDSAVDDLDKAINALFSAAKLRLSEEAPTATYCAAEDGRQ